MSDTAFLARPSLLCGTRVTWPSREAEARGIPLVPAANRWSIPSLPADHTLSSRIGHSDPLAIAQLVELLFAPLTPLARALGPQRLSETELTGVMIAAVVRRVQRRPNRLASLGNWAAKVALRAGLRELAEAGEHPSCLHLDPSFLQAAVQGSSLENTSPPDVAVRARSLFGKLLSHLSPSHRLIVYLVEVEGWSAPAIARYTGWPGWLVRWRSFVAQHRFRKLLRRLPATDL
jgi:DNA-directed RNA polymerase specialized sigma24 family protein